MKKLLVLMFLGFLTSILSAQDSGPTKFSNPNAAKAIYLKSAQEIVDYDNNGKFEEEKYYIVTCSIQGYSGLNYQLNVGTINDGYNNQSQITLNVICDSRPAQWTNRYGIVALLFMGNDGHFYVTEMIRNFQVRTDKGPWGSFMGARPSTLQDWLTGTTDERDAR